jgi:hypothetical protein
VRGGVRPRFPAGARLGGTIELVGLDAEPPELRAGEPVALTLYWRALDPVDGRWRVFVHVDARDGRARLHGDHAPAGGAFPTSAWARGDLVRDPVSIRVPSDWTAGWADVWVGLHDGEERLEVTAPGPLRTDGEQRLLAATLPVRPAPASPP